MFRIRQFYALARLTAVEAIRQPICLLLTTSCIVLIGLVPMFHLHTFGEGGKLARDGALAFHFVFGLSIAAYAACSSLTRETQSGTASAVLSKPVSRETFFLAKFAGIAMVILAFSLCAGLATLMTERVAEKFYETVGNYGYATDFLTGWLLVISPLAAYAVAAAVNYKKGRPFESTAFISTLIALVIVFLLSGLYRANGGFKPYDLQVEWRLVPVSILVTLALLVLSAVAITLSTRMGTVPTLTICAVILITGLVSDYAFGRYAAESATAEFFYRIVPNWNHFWMPDALSHDGTIPWQYVAKTACYTAVYSAGILCLGMVSFRHREMK